MEETTTVTCLTDEDILDLSKRITSKIELEDLTVKGLKLPEYMVKTAVYNKKEIQDAAREVLRTWLKKQTNKEEAFTNMMIALRRCEMNSLAAELRLWKEGRSTSPSLSESRMYL